MLTLIGFLLALFLGLPIFISLLFGALLFIYETDLLMLIDSIPIQLYGSVNQYGLLAIPLFMLVGELMNKGGLTSRLMNAIDYFVGGFKGGLAYVNLLTNAFAAAILGSATAQISIMSRLMIPTMVDKGYSKEFAAAVTLAGGLLGPIIPPSMLMIIYGVVAYQPIADLFIAGILPGLLVVFALALIIFFVGVFKGLPKNAVYASSKRDVLAGVLPAMIPLVIIGCILGGVMSPTEAGAIASMLAFILGVFVYKSICFSDLPELLLVVAKNTAMIVGLIAVAAVFGWALAFEGVPDLMVEWIAELTTSPFLFLLLVYLLVIFLGMFLESIAVMIVLVPILLPAAESFGIDPIHFGVVISLATMIGLITPPVGPGLFIAMQASNLSIARLFLAVIPFLAAILVCMVIIAAVPSISKALLGIM